MAVTSADVDHVATLARLAFDDEARERLQAQLNAILEYVDTLQALDTTDIPPIAHPFAPRAPLRPDRVQPSALSDALLAIAPKRSGRFIAVPRVIE